MNDGYESAQIVARDLARYEAECAQHSPEQTLLRQQSERYSSLDRVLVVDAHLNRAGVNGIGNLFTDYLLWFAAALATDRAVFIHWSRPPSSPRARFDLSTFYTGVTPAMDWAWNAESRQRVARRWGKPHIELTLRGKEPCALIWRALEAQAGYVQLVLEPNSGIAMTPACTTNGSARLRVAATRAATRAASDRGAAVQGPRRDVWLVEAGLRLLREQVGALRLHDVTSLTLALRAARTSSEQGSPVAPWLHGRWHADGSVTLGALRLHKEIGRDSPLGRLVSCQVHALMRPRPLLRAALVPYLEAFERADALVAVHVRSGWADDLYSLPDELEGDAAAAMRTLADALAPTPRTSAARSCQELSAEQRAELKACGERCACVPSRAEAFAAGLRELLMVAASSSDEGRYGGVDPLQILLNSSARWRLLNQVDEATPPAQPAVRAYDRRVRAPPRNLSLERYGCGGAPGLAEPPLLLPPPRTWLAHGVDCAWRVARRVAASRARNAGRSAAPGMAPRAMLHVSSDAPGLTAMLERLPALAGSVVGCLGAHCYEHESAAKQHSQRAKPSSADSLQVAIDLWVHGVADHVLPITGTSFVGFAKRSRGTGATPQLLPWRPAGDKHLPICDAMPPPLPTGQDRAARMGCLALRWAVLSSVAGSLLLPSGAQEAATLARHVHTFRRSPNVPPPPASGCIDLEGERLVRSYEINVAVAACPQAAHMPKRRALKCEDACGASIET